MSTPAQSFGPALERSIYRLYREFFDRAEKHRRWSLRDDIPWAQSNPNLDPAISHVIETFCVVELFLPDYVGKFMPLVRGSRGRAWFAANWGYEESKHSMALGDWLLHSKQRTDEQMEDVGKLAIDNEWNLPTDDVRALAIYTMAQELATWAHYRNLRHLVGPTQDPALDTLLGFVSVDEKAHYDFYVKVVRLHLEDDREGTLEQLRRVLNEFKMPAVGMLADGAQRTAEVRSLNLFNEELYFQQVYLPILEALSVQRSEMRNRAAQKKKFVTQPVE